MSSLVPLLMLILRVALLMMKRMERDTLRNQILLELAAEINKVAQHANTIEDRVDAASDEYVDKLYRELEARRAGFNQLDLPLWPSNSVGKSRVD
jgi:hypothetical protein